MSSPLIGERARQASADRPSRHVFEADRRSSASAATATARSAPASATTRRPGGDRRRAAGDARRRHLARRRYRGRADRRRGAAGIADRFGSPRPDRGRTPTSRSSSRIRPRRWPRLRHRGAAQLDELDAAHRGRTGHSSGVFGSGLGYGAIYELARILDGFRRELPEPNLTYNVGVMAGGTPAEIDADGFRVAASGKTNIIAETAVALAPFRRAGDTDPGADAGDRRPASAADRGRAGLRLRGRLSADGADRGQPSAAGPAQRGQPGPRPARDARI